jgi:membrane fusion protein, type I secretion system
MTEQVRQTSLSRSMRQHLLAGGAVVVLLIGGVGGWAAMTQISGAVAAPGSVVVDGNAKKVEHPSGGVIAELLVREGQRVTAGEIVVRLDATVTRANLAAVSKKRNQLLARQARLQAERDDLAAVAAPPDLVTRATRRDAEALMTSERRLFADRLASRDGQKSRLREQVGQLREQIVGLDAQQQAKGDEITLIAEELAGQNALFAKGLTTLYRLNSLKRQSARLSGERGQLVAGIASAKGRIAEIELQLLQVDQTMRTEVAAELRDVENQLAELAEQEIAARDLLQRIDIKAPISGAVHQLAVHTVGGVVKAGETLMQIVPQRSELTVEVRIEPKDIDQLAIGQEATLNLAAFNRNTTPELRGKLIRISADIQVDETSGLAFYVAAVAIPQAELERISDLALVPGMPVEAFIRTSERRVLSYLVKPIKDHAAHVFREE